MATYSLTKSGSTYYVSDGYSTTNANTAFIHATALLSSGDILNINAGTYTAADTEFTIENIVGATINFLSGAVFTIADSSNISVLAINYCEDLNINNPELNGNKAHQSTAWLTDGIVQYNSGNIVITGANIYDCYRDGYAAYSDDPATTASTIQNSTITRCGWNGITIGEGQNGSIAKYNNISHCSDVGISLYALGNIAEGNTIIDMDGTANTQAHWGIGVEGAGGTSENHTQIKSNILENCGNGIVLAKESAGTTEYVDILGNTLTDCRQYNNYAGAITLSNSPACNYNTIGGNSIINAELGIFIAGSNATANVIYNDNVFSNCTVEIQDLGTDTIYSGGSSPSAQIALIYASLKNLRQK